MLRAILKQEKGSALTFLIVITVIGITTTMAAIFISASASKAALAFATSETVAQMAQSGIDTAVLKLLRNSNYTGEMMSIDTGTVTITVNGEVQKTIIADAVYADIQRKYELRGTLTSAFAIESFSETF